MASFKFRVSSFIPWIGAVFTGLLLFSVFPPLGWSDAAWVALIPLMLVVRGMPTRRALRMGYLAGLVCWIPSLFWVHLVTVPGWLSLAFYCAVYLMPFAFLVAWWTRRWGVDRWQMNLLLMLAASAMWAGFEYLRGILFTGFAWNTLGVSLYRNLSLLQVARWGGAYAVSAIIVWANAGVALTLMRYVAARGRGRRHAHPELMLGLLLVIVVLMHGWKSLRVDQITTQPLRISLIQARIPQADYYIPQQFSSIQEKLGELSRGALRAGEPDLLVWSETAIPDDLKTSFDSYDLVYSLVTNGTPLLVGSMDTDWTDTGPRFYNSSFLVDTNGIIVEGYDKRHLVLFGEYVPLRHIFPFLKMVTPIQASFSPGSTSTVFRLESPAVTFSVLICFEDAVASLARESVRNGARLLINQTNDGWFDARTEPLQHMMQCVLRCVENGVPAVRAANTGISCFIERNGRVHDVLSDGDGNTYVVGFRTAAVDVPGDDMPLTFYTRHGDLFAQACAGISIAILFGAWILLRNEKKNAL